MNPEYGAEQLSICKRLGVSLFLSEAHQKLGVSGNILNGSWSWPLNKCQRYEAFLSLQSVQSWRKRAKRLIKEDA